MQERLHAIAGPNWRVFPFNNSHDKREGALAKIVEDAFRRVPHLQSARLRIAQAVFRGQSAELITGKRKVASLGGLPPQKWWLPNRLTQIDPRRFTVRPIRETQPDGSYRVRGKLYMSTVPMGVYGGTSMPKPGSRQVGSDGLGRPIYDDPYGAKSGDPRAQDTIPFPNYRPVAHPEWFVRVVYNDEESRLGYGRGIMDCLFFYGWIKQVLLRESLQGVEKWSQGIVVGRIDEDRVGAADDQTMENERAKMMKALIEMRSRHVIVTGKRDEIQVVTGGGEGYQIVQGMRDYIDDCIMAVCTGAVLMSSKSNAGSLGSLSRDEVGRDTQRGVILYDQNKMDEDFTLDAVGLFLRLNRQNLLELGLADCGRPDFRTVGAKHVDPDRAAGRFVQIASTHPDGFAVRKDEYFEQLDLTPPQEDDEVVMLGGSGAGGQVHGSEGQFAPSAGGKGGEREDDRSEERQAPPDEYAQAMRALPAIPRSDDGPTVEDYESAFRAGHK